MTTLDDLPFHDGQESSPTANGATGRKPCRRHDWDMSLVNDFRVSRCNRCGVLRNEDAIRRGRTSLRAGKDAERAIAREYGGKRTGQYGGPDDVVVGDLFVIQSKAGRTWFRQAVVDELDKLPRTGGRIPTLVISDRPGPGHRTRRYVVRLIEDDVALHGERP